MSQSDKSLISSGRKTKHIFELLDILRNRELTGMIINKNAL
jgi:hypothetical protein